MHSRAKTDRGHLRKNSYLPTAYHYHETPMALTRAKKQFVWDADDRKYLDAVGGIVCISAGHNHNRIQNRLREAIDQDAIQHTSYLYDNPGVGELTERLLSKAPHSLERVGFVNSGSEANELALTAARHSKGIQTVAHFEHSYHGGTSGTLNLCGHSSWRFKNQANAGSVAVKVPYCYRCPFGKKKQTCGLECAKSIKETLSTVTSGSIAAFIAEPILGVGGFIDPPKEFFGELQQIVKDFDGLYISDEVQTGVGRCGQSFFHTEALGIDADVITMAKGLGNGAPIAACLGKSSVFESMRGKTLFNTFGGDTWQSIQAAETLSIIEDEDLMTNAHELGAHMIEGFLRLQKSFPLIGDIRGSGLLLGIELVKDPVSKEHASNEANLVMEYCKEEGVLLGKGGLQGNVLRLAPPMCLNRNDADEILHVIGRALAKLANPL